MVTLPPTGCNAAQLAEGEAVVNAVLGAATNLANVAEPGASWTPELTSAVAGLKKAEANFEAGTGAQAEVSNALLAVEDVLSAVEPTSKTSTLVDILVTAIDAALVYFPAPAAAGATARLGPPHLMNAGFLTYAAAHPKYNHHGKATIRHRFGRSRAGDFKAAWNKAVGARPELAPAKLQ
jgi:hypothetical protein